MAAPSAFAGGGPSHVLVLYNNADPAALEVADRYAALRSLPAGHLCGIDGVDPAADAISFTTYAATIQPAVAACLDALPEPGAIDYLVLVRGLPYRVDIEAGYVASLDAVLQVWGAADGRGEAVAGRAQADSDGLYYASIDNPQFIPGRANSGDFTLENPYQSWYTAASSLSRSPEWPESFRRENAGYVAGIDYDDNLFVVTRLDGFDHDDAMALAERGSAADGSFPAGRWICMESADSARGARDPECELASRLLESAGFDAAFRSPHDAALSGETLAAYLTGAAELRDGIAGNTFSPGAIADNLTSYGAVPQNFHCSADGASCPESESQTSIARFVRAGATGVHGAVAEPLNNCFPNAGVLLLYAAGYNLGESFLFSQRYLYWQNILLGDPLATPWDERPLVALPVELSEGEPIEVTATHPRGVAALRLYVDGALLSEAEGDALEYFPDASEGEALSLLAVAVAADAAWEVPGWPEPAPMPRPQTQGWATALLPVGPPTPDSEDSGLGPAKGCGCAGGGVPGSPLAALALLATRRRRGPSLRPTPARSVESNRDALGSRADLPYTVGVLPSPPAHRPPLRPTHSCSFEPT